MKQEELNEILEKHKKWLQDKLDGERANLRGADLRRKKLVGANLQNAELHLSKGKGE